MQFNIYKLLYHIHNSTKYDLGSCGSATQRVNVATNNYLNSWKLTNKKVEELLKIDIPYFSIANEGTLSFYMDNWTALNKIGYSFIYLLYQNNDCVYVGKTKNPLKRIPMHLIKSKHTNFKEFNSLRLVKVKTEYIDLFERKLIRYLDPLYNGNV